MDWQDRQISSGAGEGRVSNPSVLSLAVRQFSTTALERTPRDFCPAHHRRDAQPPRRHTKRNVFQVMSGRVDRKSTRLNSSHRTISYAVFCLKKKKEYDRSIP